MWGCFITYSAGADTCGNDWSERMRVQASKDYFDAMQSLAARRDCPVLVRSVRVVGLFLLSFDFFAFLEVYRSLVIEAQLLWLLPLVFDLVTLGIWRIKQSNAFESGCESTCASWSERSENSK